MKNRHKLLIFLLCFTMLFGTVSPVYAEENSESMEEVETAENTEAAENTENLEAAESTDPTKSNELAESPDDFVAAENAEIPEATESTEGEQNGPDAPSAPQTVDSGSFGNDFTWTLYDNGELVISGTGYSGVGYGDTNLPPWYRYRKSITRVTYEAGALDISVYAFYNCSSLTEISLPDTLLEIGICAFYGCTSLSSIEIPNGVQVINHFAFENCSSLTEMTIPDSVKTLGEGVFLRCSGVKRVRLPEGITYMHSTFQGCSSLTDVVIPDSVLRFGSMVFQDCSSLEEIVIPDGAENIGMSMFSGCTSLKKVTIPDSVESIEMNAFFDCTNLAEIIIPDSVTSVADGAFMNGSSLEDITLSKNLESIGPSMFVGCSSLRGLMIPESVTEIKRCAFYNCIDLEGVVLPESVNSVAESAFYNCSNLKYVVFLNDIVSIDVENTFSGSNPVLYGHAGSAAEAFAAENGLTFREYREGMELPEEEPITVPPQEDRIDLSGAVTTSITNQAYTGSPQMPAPEVWVDGKCLIKDRDYTLSYENNTEPGTATVIITGIGNYTGEKRETFEIYWTYQVVFFPNGGNGELQKSSYRSGAGVTLGTHFSKAYYKVGSWNTKADGSGISYPTKERVTDLAGINGTIVLYAQWEPIQYSISVMDFIEAGYEFCGDGYPNPKYSRSSDIPKYYTVETDTFTIEKPEVPGYQVYGWLVKRDKNVADEYETFIAGETLTIEKGSHGNIQIYPWLGHHLVLDANYYGDYWEWVDYLIDTTDDSVYLPDDTFIRPGYKLIGWRTSSSIDYGTAYPCGKKVTEMQWNDSNETHLYAQWEKAPGKVTFQANGGKGTMSVQTINYGESERLKANAFSREGYTFFGWNTRADGKGVSYGNKDRVDQLFQTNNGIATLYAQWTPNVKAYTIKFTANGGTGTMASQKMTVGKSAALNANAFTRNGYIFAGWNTKANGSGTLYANKESVKDLKTANGASITLYAQWKSKTAKKTYTIKFNANGGSGTMKTKKMTVGKAARLTKNAFKRSGYAFAGWSTKADSSGKTYKNKARVKNLTKTDGGVVILYAKWTQKLTKLVLSGSSSVTAGSTIQLTCTKTPSGATDKLTYSSSNKAVATVNSSGVVKGIKAGTATITVKAANGVKTTKKITVTAKKAAAPNEYYFGPAGSVSNYKSGVTVAPKKLSYSGSTLILSAYVVNNTAYTLDSYNNMVITVYNSAGKKIASKNFGTVDMNLSKKSIKTVTFKFSGASVLDLKNGGSIKVTGTAWFD